MADDNSTKAEPDQLESEDRMSDAQRISLDTLFDEAGEPTPDDHLSREEAAQKIAELREEAGYDTSTDDQDEP